MLLAEGFKLIDNSADCTGDRELYDLRNDPKEARNLAADPKHRDRAESYCRQLMAWRKQKPEPVRVSGMSTPAYAEAAEPAAGPARRRRAVR